MNGEALDEMARLVEQVSWFLLAAVAAWYGLCVGACVAARLRPGRPHVARLARFAPAIVRQWAGLACTASFVLAPHAASAVEREPATQIPVVVIRADAAEPRTAQRGSHVIDEPVVRTPEAPSPPAAVPATVVPPPSPVSASGNHVVAPNENLWVIARAALGGDPSDAEIARYWRAVVDANRVTLRSGNPNLIYAGEVVLLPTQTG